MILAYSELLHQSSLSFHEIQEWLIDMNVTIIIITDQLLN